MSLCFVVFYNKKTNGSLVLTNNFDVIVYM